VLISNYINFWNQSFTR